MDVKSGMIAVLLTLFVALHATGQGEVKTTLAPPPNSQIDFDGFIRIALEVQGVRESRRVPIAKFTEMASEKGTVILDTRAKWAYDSVHIRGAIHLNYSDFSKDKLQKILPNKNTRILIYCNNNFIQGVKPPKELESQGNKEIEIDEEEVITGTTIKQPSTALNIPTFITLWAYGYQNIYELADALPLEHPQLHLEGTAIKSPVQK